MPPDEGPSSHGRARGQLRVLLIGPNALFLAALTKIIEDELPAQVERTVNDERAFSTLARTAADVLICDLRSRPLGGAEVMARTRRLNPVPRGILLADPEDAPWLLAALGSGAAGFLTKDASPEQFVATVDDVVEGRVVVGGTVLAPGLDQLLDDPEQWLSAEHRISAAEQAILALVLRGQSVPEIAANRRIGHSSVLDQLSSIYRKLSRPSAAPVTVRRTGVRQP